MSKSTEKLLRGKGLFAQLETCRNEDKAINVLKCENLWGVAVNFSSPELEELKQSHKNSEIEAYEILILN